MRSKPRRRQAVSQILKGEARYDLVVRYQEPYRRTMEDIATSGSWRRRRTCFNRQMCDIKLETAIADFPAKATRVTWPSSTVSPDATWQHGDGTR